MSTMTLITEDAIEQTALEWLENLGYKIAYGPDISPVGDTLTPTLTPTLSQWERESYEDVVLLGRLRSALEHINSTLPADAIDEAVRKITRSESPSLIENNRAFQKMLTDGVDIAWMGAEGKKHDKAWLMDTTNPDNNDWLAVNQFTVVEDKRERRPDIVLFVNGLPLAVIELKNAADEKATIRHAYNQLQTYKDQIPSLFTYNELLIISDGMQARAGTLTSGWDRFMPWRTINGTDLYREPGNEKQSDGTVQPGPETLLKGMLDRGRFLDYCLNFITFE